MARSQRLPPEHGQLEFFANIISCALLRTNGYACCAMSSHHLDVTHQWPFSHFHMLAVQKQAKDATFDQRNFGAPSKAEQRPNAYIPENLGIPKPYGNYAPFKPSEPGSTMRHMRIPQPKPVVI